MRWRQLQLAGLGPAVIPLPTEEAAAVSRRASACTSRTRYGLNEAAFDSIDRLDVEEPGPDARRWLAERVGAGELLLVFGPGESFRLPAALFLDRWQDMFCPSRDDVVILPASGGWALLYCHEDEFEFARGGPAEQNAEP
jgi:hypothetical protein